MVHRMRRLLDRFFRKVLAGFSANMDDLKNR